MGLTGSKFLEDSFAKDSNCSEKHSQECLTDILHLPESQPHIVPQSKRTLVDMRLLTIAYIEGESRF